MRKSNIKNHSLPRLASRDAGARNAKLKKGLHLGETNSTILIFLFLIFDFLLPSLANHLPDEIRPARLPTSWKFEARNPKYETWLVARRSSLERRDTRDETQVTGDVSDFDIRNSKFPQGGCQVINRFMQESFELRASFEYRGQFLTPEDKDRLHKLAKEASDQLETIAKAQSRLKQQIEDYQGDDWDDRYGASGLWRAVFAQLYKTRLSKCEIDFYVALSADQPQKNNILHKIIAEIESLDKTYGITNPQGARFATSCKMCAGQLLKAKTLALLGESEPTYRPLAIEQLDLLIAAMDATGPAKAPDLQPIYFRAVIEKIKLTGQTEPNQLNKLVSKLADNRAADLELILSLAFLQRRYDPKGFERTVQLWPQIENLVGSLLLSDLSNRIARGQLTKQDLQNFSIFEAELATAAAWKNNPQHYKILLYYLSSIEKFQTPLILYVAAVALAKTQPDLAINLLIKASTLQSTAKQKSDKLNMESYKIAEQAAKLAYNLFVEDPANCQLAIAAFDNYYQMAGEKIDEEMEYLYAVVLNSCGQSGQGKKLLEKIANRRYGSRRNQARFDLILQALEAQNSESMLKQLRDLITSCGKNENKLRRDATTLYCRLLLELKDKNAAQEVIDILDKLGTIDGVDLDLYRAIALQQLGRLEESVHYMVSAIRVNNGSLAGKVSELLYEVVDRIEQWQLQANDFSRMIDDCKKLAEFSNKCFDDHRTALLLAEISIFAAGPHLAGTPADKDKGKLLEAEKLLNNLARGDISNDVNLLRCRARLLTAQGKFKQAAQLWNQLAQIHRKFEIFEQSWKWWRAKFYEFACLAKWTHTKKDDIAHSIEVLESSFDHIPPLWADKLNSLKQHCRSELTNECK